MVLALTATGVAKFTCCQPVAVSPVKVAVASSWPVAGPEAADVGPRVAGALVEPDAGDEARRRGWNFTPTSTGLRVVGRGSGGHSGRRPDACRGSPASTSTVRPSDGRLDVAAVVDRPDHDRHGCPCRIGSRRSSRWLGPSPGARWRRRRPRPRRRRPRRRRCRSPVPVIVIGCRRDGAPAAGEVIVEVGGGGVGRRGRRTSPAGAGRLGPMSARRLTVACCIRTSVVRARRRSWTGVQAPRPLDRSGAEDQRAARRAGTASGCGSRSRPVRSCRSRAGSVASTYSGRRRQVDQPGRRGIRCPGPRPTRSRACRPGSVAVWPGARSPPTCCARTAACRTPAGTCIASLAVPLTMKSVPVSAFSGLPPSAGGLKRGSRHVPVQVGGRVDLGVGVRLLVADQRPVRRARAVDARSPSGSSRRSRCREEREVHAGVARRLDVGALLVRPVLVVADGHEDLVVRAASPPRGRCRRR